MSTIALITGASSGFGEACARAFAAAGYALVLVARREEKLKQLAAELRSTTAVHVACADMTDAAAVKALVQNLPESFQVVDVLINNAGLALGIARAHETDLQDWEIMVDTNIKGLMRITHHLLPGMVLRNRGHIINIGSVAGNWPYPGGNVYGATKAFVQQFSRNLRAELLGKHIRVTNLEPGMAETQFSVVRMKGDAEKASQVYQNTQPLTAKDIADIALWVASLPSHVNINTLEVMPTCQAWNPFAVSREM
ncbi:MAG TPA: SDR family NAD(P)-dependent oxidoreductase [Cellvibrio sp.]|nr:SDR family NAD(P)-dependent oxidoreductase [Cellvibrio sp.]